MNLAPTVLGSHAVTRLHELQREHVLIVGSDKLTRHNLAAVGCFNFVAARFLTTALKELGAKSLRDVFDNHAPRSLAMPHVGVISLAVLGAAFESKNIGGQNPLQAWVMKHQEKVVTFDTMKHREAKAEREAKKDAKRRKRAQERSAHEQQVAAVLAKSA
jgi:hypothetical protein